MHAPPTIKYQQTVPADCGREFHSLRPLLTFSTIQLVQIALSLLGLPVVHRFKQNGIQNPKTLSGPWKAGTAWFAWVLESLVSSRGLIILSSGPRARVVLESSHPSLLSTQKAKKKEKSFARSQPSGPSKKERRRSHCCADCANRTLALLRASNR